MREKKYEYSNKVHWDYLFRYNKSQDTCEVLTVHIYKTWNNSIGYDECSVFGTFSDSKGISHVN